MGEGGVFRIEVPEPIEDLLEAARVEARKRVEEERRRVSEDVGAILAHLAEELGVRGGATLFPPGFSARALRRAASPSAEALRRFRSELDVDLRGYLVRCKIETAKGLLRYLRQYQRRTEEALTLLGRSIALAEALGRPRVLVSSLLQRVAILAPRGEHRATIADLRRALGALEDLGEPGLALVARCDLATAYVLAGRPRQALKMLPGARALCAELGEAVTRHQLDWTEGLARQALGELELAGQRLEAARVGLLELGAEGYAAVVALDQAILCLERGRHQEVPRLAAGALPVFERLGLGREAVATLELLRRAIVEDAVTLPILSEARARLAASLRDPALRPSTR